VFKTGHGINDLNVETLKNGLKDITNGKRKHDVHTIRINSWGGSIHIGE